MKVDAKKFFAALLFFCAAIVGIAVHDYKDVDNAIFETIAKSLILFLGALPLMLLYRNLLAQKVDYLSDEIDATSEKLYETTTLLEEKVEEKTKELIDEGFQDPLTHLANRHRLVFDMDRYAYHSLIIIHLKNFKELNHFFGRAVGDSLLQQFGLWLERMNYNGYRLGSNEFALLIEQEFSHYEATSFCEEFLDHLSKHSFTAGMENVSLYVNMGIHTGDELSLAHADAALKSALETSETFVLYKAYDEWEPQHHDNIQTAANIREAFYAGRIICHYQPIISTLTGDVEKYETLARLIHIDNTIVPPHDFLEVSQKTRLYPQITQEIVRQACEAFKDRDESFSVHLCALDIMNDSTIGFIEDTIAKSGTANRIIFEICEQDIYENYTPVALFIQHIKRLGAKVAIDNFGSSYSNFDKIIHLDIDYLKIDGSLINKIMHTQRHAQIIKTIASFADAIGAKSIAENVETTEILEQLQNMGINFAQGYYIGEPAPLTLYKKS